MRVIAIVVLVSWCAGTELRAQDLEERARQMEAGSDALGARILLDGASRRDSSNRAVLTDYAEFLDRRGDPDARDVYERLLVLVPPSETGRRADLLRRMIILDLLAGDNAAAEDHVAAYRAEGGERLAAAEVPQQPLEGPSEQYMEIPGPLGSFARMIAITADAKPETILPAIARSVVRRGYRASDRYEGLEPTEYLKLAMRYLSQARELEQLADESGTIRIESCESPETGELLRVLGYRMRGSCGTDVILETVNASRAFLTIDSGFPLAEFEQALRTSRPFLHSYEPSRVPFLYEADYWRSAQDRKRDEPLIDMFLGDPSVSRLYVALAKLTPETGDAIRNATGARRLKAFAHVLDFFGALFEVRQGRAIVPGGARSEQAWADLVGVSPARGGEFFARLIARDDGWMASYFDVLMRARGPIQEYLTEPVRMGRFYQAVRGRVTSPGPARPVLPANADLMLLVTRLQIGEDGRPKVPGGLAVWQDLFIQNPEKEYDRNLARNARSWNDPDDLIEALFALCRKPTGNVPLQIFMAASDIDRRRSEPLAPATVDRLARAWSERGAQYPIFTETGSLSDQTIVTFIDKTDEVEKIGDRILRADTAGSMQALVGLWQILVRNGSLPESEADSVLATILAQFDRPGDKATLYDRTTTGLEALLAATGTPAGPSPQNRIIDLLAGAAAPTDAETHQLLVQDLIRYFEAQKLISLDDIFDLAALLDRSASGNPNLDSEVINRVMTRLEEIQTPSQGLTVTERSALSPGYWPEQHIRSQRRLDLRSEIRQAAGDPGRLRQLRGDLAPILRDTLVGFNYLHYAPPAAQLLLTNPRFVRGHDFIGFLKSQHTWSNTKVSPGGWPSNNGGRLVGSLAGLPYALAEAEQNFLVPVEEQALIWTDLVPQMILNAKIPRWWGVSASQMHWLALHLRVAESAFAEAALLPDYRRNVLDLLGRQATPARVRATEQHLLIGDVRGALDRITPSELYAVAVDLLADGYTDDVLSREIRRLQAEHPDQINYEAISRAFGSPKPTLTTSYRPGLLQLRTFPTLMGYSSRIMAESWESNLLYFAALADEMYLRPSQLNLYVPQWTEQAVEKIFATHLDDWPAVLDSLRWVGDAARNDLGRRVGGTEQASRQ